MAINIKELKGGNAYTEGQDLFLCISNAQNKQGRLSGKYMVKRKNMRTGSITEISYNPTAKIETVTIDKKVMSYSYNDGNGSLVFMDNETFDTIDIPEERLTWEMNFLIEGNEVTITIYNGEVLGVQLPQNVAFKVAECEQAVKGDTATGASKYAKIETGFQIKVPLFIKEGEMVVVDTISGDYKGRA